VAAARGMQVILCNTDEDPAKEAMYLDLMHQERAAGVILAPSRQRVAQTERPAGERPVVLIDRAIPGRTSIACCSTTNAWPPCWWNISTPVATAAWPACLAR
jgi:DNA-binding LacI/PurR family transcriptional regulator